MRTALLRVVALCAGTAAALVLAELALRLLGLAPTGGVVTVGEREFGEVPGLFAPHQDLVSSRIPALPHRIRINSLGYRGPEVPREKPEGELRLLLVGDSFTWGDFVDDGDTLPAQLEGALSARCGAVRVINGGVGGTTIVTHAKMAERGLTLAPDAVVLTFSENDLKDLVAPLWDELAANRARKSRFPLSWIYPAAHHLALWNFGLELRGWWNAWRKARAVEAQISAGAGPGGPREAPLRELRTRYADALADLAHRLADAGVPLVFAVYPSHGALAEADPERTRWALAAGRRAGLLSVDLRVPLRESGEPVEVLYLLPHDGHPSPRGYALAAAFLAREIQALPVVTERCRLAPAETSHTAAISATPR